MASAPLSGLSSREAKERLQRAGPNVVGEEARRSWWAFLRKLWEPVPWMLEVAILLELGLGKGTEAGIIAALLLGNAVLSFLQEDQAQNALRLLRRRLEVRARVLRDGRWQRVPAREVVPGDVLHLRMGDIVPADVRVTDGQLLVDQSALTGESLPVEVEAGATAFAGAMAKRGEATGEVSATGARTYFGKTTELVRTAKTASHLQQIVFTIVRYLIALDLFLVVAMLINALARHLDFREVLPFALVVLVASIPVALPATFTLASALGAMELAKRGVLVTRLSSIEEAAAVDVLCSDKTGTITKNELTVSAIRSYPPFSEEDVLRSAALASDEATQDPLDLAILARTRGIPLAEATRLEFVPFDPSTKRTEALIAMGAKRLRVAKGAPQAIGALCAHGRDQLERDVQVLAEQGFRVLAVASGSEDGWLLAGVLALQDPPREDSADLVRRLRELGVRILLITGDGLATAKAIASKVGLGKGACLAEAIHPQEPPPLECEIFAGVLPEDKYHLVKSLQQAHHTVGMTGDGVNDAPALKQAEVGIAVASATDVAQAAASMVLTSPGLGNIIEAIETSRRIYQRMLTYTLNKIIKTFEIAFFLSLSMILTGTILTTPLLIVLLLFTNDFVTMSLATDRVTYSRSPDRWNIRPLVVIALILAACLMALEFGVYGGARDRLPLPELRTLVFLMLVFSGHGTVYLVRERQHFWNSRPSGWLLGSSLLAIVFVSFLAIEGIFMAPLPPVWVGLIMGLVILYLTALDFLKIRIFRAFYR